MAEEEEEQEEIEEKPPPAGSLARYFFLILLILVIEGVGAYLFLDSLIPPVEDFAQETEEEVETLDQITIPIPIFYENMEKMVINLPAVKGGHLIQISLAFQVDNPKVLEEIALKKSILWDLVIRRLETYTLPEIRDPVKQDLRNDIQGVLNKELINGEIVDVLFTDLVVQ